MAKDKAYQRAKAGILASGIAARGATKAEFKWTQSALGSIYGNLGTTLGGGRAGLTSAQAALLGKLAKAQQTQTQGAGRIAGRSAATVRNMYGSAVGAGSAPGQDMVKAVGRAGQTTVAGQARGGSILGKANLAAYTSLQQGAQAAQAGANAQLADARMYRAKNDAALQAQQLNALDMARYQNQLDIQNYKKKLALDEQKSAGNLAGIQGVASSASQASGALWTTFNTWVGADSQPVADQAGVHQDDNGSWVDADGNPVHAPTAGEAVTQYVQDNAISDPNEVAVISAIARTMYQAGAGHAPGAYSATPDELAQAVTQQLAILYPQYKSKSNETIQSLIKSNFDLSALKAQVPSMPAPQDSGMTRGEEYMHQLLDQQLVGAGYVQKGQYWYKDGKKYRANYEHGTVEEVK